MELLRNKLINSNVINKNDPFNIDILKKMLKDKFNEIDFNEAKEDVIPFIKDTKKLESWNKNYFILLTDEYL